MMTAKMMEALKNAGIAKEWHKGDMHRLYIDLSKASDLYYDNYETANFDWARLGINRRERDNGKLWVDLETGEIFSKGIYNSGEVISQIMELVNFLAPDEVEDKEKAEESISIDEVPLTYPEIYDICKEAHIVLIPESGNLRVRNDLPKEMIVKIKAHKAEIVDAMSGYCFQHDVYASNKMHNWAILKRANIADVSFPPVIVVKGSAQEVDAWAREHKDDPFFTDKYTSKYSFCHFEE